MSDEPRPRAEGSGTGQRILTIGLYTCVTAICIAVTGVILAGLWSLAVAILP